MGTKTAVLRAASGTATGNVDFTTSDLGGLTPKGVLIFHNSNVLNNTVNDHANFGIGAATATDEEWAIAVSSEHNVGTSDTYRYGITDGCLLFLSPTNGAVDGEANFVSFITNGVRLNFSNAPAFSYQTTFVFFAGTDVEAYAGKFDCPSTSLDITAPGFEPNLVILGQMAAPMSDATQGYAELTVGFCSNETAITQGCSTWYSQDGRSTMEIYGMSSALYAIQSLTSSARKYGISLGSFDSSGFTATLATGSADTTDDIGYLAIKLGSGLETWVGAVDTRTSTGTQGYTGPGFKPEALIAVPTFTSAVDTHYDDGQGAAMGVSAADADDEFCHSVADEDGASTSNSQQYSANVALHLHQDDGSAGYVASLDSLDTNGWTWDFTTVNGTARKVIVLAIEGITVTEETGSFTGNAVIQRTPSGSVTANAVLQRIEAGSITANAVLQRLDLADTFTAAAVLQRIESDTYTADAVLKRLDLTDTFLADAVLQRIESDTYTADAVVQHLDLIDTFTAQAVLQRIESGTYTADAYIQTGIEVIEGDFDADAVILTVQEDTLDADAVIERLDETDTFTAQAVLQRIESGTFDADSVLQRTEGDTFTAQAVLWRIEAGTFTAAAVLQRIESGTFDADAYLIWVITDTFSADASISRFDITDTFSADAMIVQTIGGTFTADAKITKGVIALFLANAVIAKYDLVDTFTAQAVLRRIEAGSFSADAFLVYRYEEAFSADATIFKADNVQTFSADAWIVATGEKLILASAVLKRIESGSFTADARILEVDTTSDTIAADAVIQATQEASFTAASVVHATTTGFLFADAYIKSDLYVRTSSFTARAWITRTGEVDPTPEFRIEDVKPPNPRGSPKGRGYRLNHAQPKAMDGNRKSVGAIGYPWIEIIFEFCDVEVFDWYNAWVPDDEAWANIDSVQCWDPFATGGAQWVLFEGADIRIWKPTVNANLGDYYSGVRIIITNLS